MQRNTLATDHRDLHPYSRTVHRVSATLMVLQLLAILPMAGLSSLRLIRLATKVARAAKQRGP